MEAAGLAIELGICVYFDHILYCRDIFVAIVFR